MIRTIADEHTRQATRFEFVFGVVSKAGEDPTPEGAKRVIRWFSLKQKFERRGVFEEGNRKSVYYMNGSTESFYP